MVLIWEPTQLFMMPAYLPFARKELSMKKFLNEGLRYKCKTCKSHNGKFERKLRE